MADNRNDVYELLCLLNLSPDARTRIAAPITALCADLGIDPVRLRQLGDKAASSGFKIRGWSKGAVVLTDVSVAPARRAALNYWHQRYE